MGMDADVKYEGWGLFTYLWTSKIFFSLTFCMNVTRISTCSFKNRQACFSSMFLRKNSEVKSFESPGNASAL